MRADAGDALVRDLRASAPGPGEPELVMGTGSEPGALVEKVLAAMGGLQRFIRRGDKVLVKPNMAWARTPLQAANTNPEVVAAVVRAALAAGASRVIVGDSTCDAAERAYEKSGIAAKASDAGAEVILPGPDKFRDISLRGRQLDQWPVFTPVLEVDRVINVPIAKHHSLGKLTCALKNWFGIVGGDRHRLHYDLGVAITDLNRFLRPTLTVVDATRVLLRNGPRGGNLDDTLDKNTVLASVDPVAADAYACTLLGFNPGEVAHLMAAEAEGLGTSDWKRLRTREV
jgi:uncharacterized protein (DUF362 family)